MELYHILTSQQLSLKDFVYSKFINVILYIFIENSTFDLEDVSRFVSGTSSISIASLGAISIYFKHDCSKSPKDGTACTCRPISSVCAVSITIPIHRNTLDELTKGFNEAIKHMRVYGFGLH